VRRLIYPATRAVEHAAAQPGVRPIRLFPVLWPLWQVEVSAEVYHRQDFEVIDHFVMRAIGECGIHDRHELAAFLHLPAGLIDRCLTFLATIQQVAVTGPTVALTQLGNRSLRDGVRYVAATDRLTILIERQSGRPFPRWHYDGDVRILDTPEIQDGQLADKMRFMPVFTTAPYQRGVLQQLEQHPDRAQFNLPTQLRNLREEGVRDGFLPSYLVQTADGQILAYTNAAEERDDFLEQLCTDTAVEHLIEAKGLRDPQKIWNAWLAESKVYGAGRLKESPDGWQVVLDPGAFGEPPKIPLTRIGSFQFRDNHVLQVWCADAGTRRKALIERCLGIATLPDVATVADLDDRIRDLAGKLHVDAVTVATLRTYAERNGGEKRASRLAALARLGV
jgi:hypothetical protein